MRGFYALLVLSLAVLAAASASGAGDRAVDRSAQRLIELLHAREWTRIARSYYVRDVDQYRRLFPENARGLTSRQLEDDIVLGRNSLKLDAAVGVRDLGSALDQWTYLKTFHWQDEGEEEGRIIISLFRVGSSGVDRLDIGLSGVVDDGAIVLFGESAIGFDRALGSD